MTFLPSSAGLPEIALCRLSVVTAPSAEPVTTDEVKLWLRVDDTADDALIAGLITAARSIFEQLTGRALVETTYLATWDGLPRVGTYGGAGLSRELELPRAPFAATSPVAWLKYLDEDGVEQTVASSDYTVETGRDAARYPRLVLNEAASWPTLGSYPGALRCQFTAGYGAASDVPAEIKVCLKQLVTHLYQNRAPVNVGNIVNELPWALSTLIELHRIRSLV